LAGNFSFGMLFFALAIPALLLIIVGVVSGSAGLMVGCGPLALVYLILLALVQSALQAIFQAAVFL
jgi:hypothetical protein